MVYNKECYKILIQLLFFIDCMKFEGHDLCNINQMTINTINDLCNMTYEYYTHKSFNPLEVKLNTIIAKNPKLLDNNNIKHLLIKKYSHISLISNKYCFINGEKIDTYKYPSTYTKIFTTI